MKTAIQELVDKLKPHIHLEWPMNKWLRNVVNEALEKEKEQSIELIKQTAMFMAASNLDSEIAKMSYEDIYNSYYNQNE
jgi:hypothetical protein